MNSSQIKDYINKKYPWSFNPENKKIIIVYIEKKIKFCIGKVLFFDSNSMGVRIIGSTDCILYNFGKSKTLSHNTKNVLIINPLNKTDDLYQDCENTINSIISEIEQNSSLKIEYK